MKMPSKFIVLLSFTQIEELEREMGLEEFISCRLCNSQKEEKEEKEV